MTLREAKKAFFSFFIKKLLLFKNRTQNVIAACKGFTPNFASRSLPACLWQAGPLGRSRLSLLNKTILLVAIPWLSYGQFQPFPQALSARNSSYDMNLRLDTETHQVQAKQTVTFINPSDDTIWTMPFHLYYNAFKNNKSTFNSSKSRIPISKSQAEIDDCTWGWIEVIDIKDEMGNDLTENAQYVSYDDGNKLKSVTDGSGTSEGFNDGNTSEIDYTYDVNGNMIADHNKGITNITYNHLNLPEAVSVNNTAHTGNIQYIYDATGAKLKKIATEGSSLTETEYAGNYIYKNGTLEFFNHPEGYIEKETDGYKYVYQYKDHLGNIRLSYSDKDGDGYRDTEDRCPNQAGTKLLNGCPDCDGDGLADAIDKCPEESGDFETDGCPLESVDSDGDGFLNIDDECPKEKGTLNGCPDKDGDKVADWQDKCPAVFGNKNNDGCPELSKNEKEVLLDLLIDKFTYFYSKEGLIDYVLDPKINQDGFVFTNKNENIYSGKFFKEETLVPTEKDL